MEWLLPAGLWAFASLAVVITLYILRRKAKRVDVPSLLLWQRTQSAQEASKPFQRLRKQWLLILQLLMAALLAFALMRPAMTGGLHGEIALVIDVSASMQAESAGKSRLKLAVEDALALVDGLTDGDAVTVLTAGSRVGQAITRSTDKQKIKAVLSGLKAENGTGDMDGAVSLAQAMRRDIPALSILIYTDSYASSDEGLEIRAVGTEADNWAVLSLACTAQEQELRAFARVASYGAAREVTLECYADGVLCDIRTLHMEAGSQQSAQFTAPLEAQQVSVVITGQDALAADDARYWVAQDPHKRRALLVTEGNVFLEKALALREDLEVFKTTAVDSQGLTGFDLYILDGDCQGFMPEAGAILALDPTQDILGIHSEAEQKVSSTLRKGVGRGVDAMTKNLLLSDFSLRVYHPLTGGESMLTWGGHTLLATDEQQGRRAAVLGFDLHDSNLSMKADFPILMQNLMDYLLPEAVMAVDGAECGQPLTLALDDRTLSSQVVTPSGRRLALAGQELADTMEIGVYRLEEERADQGQRTTLFTLHMPASESDVRSVASSSGGAASGEVGRAGHGQELTVFFLLALLILSLVEWEVSRRGT